MMQFTGKSVYKGIASGPIAVLRNQDGQIKQRVIKDAEAEIERVKAAGIQAGEQLRKLYDKALEEAGECAAAVFEAHQMLLEDEGYLESIYDTIRTKRVNAACAVQATGDGFAEKFDAMDDDYMRARAADVRDISNRLAGILEVHGEKEPVVAEPSIIVADDLSPGETMQIGREKILGFVTVHGSENSHTAILARTMGIPALVGVPLDLEELHTGSHERAGERDQGRKARLPVRQYRKRGRCGICAGERRGGHRAVPQ